MDTREGNLVPDVNFDELEKKVREIDLDNLSPNAKKYIATHFNGDIDVAKRLLKKVTRKLDGKEATSLRIGRNSPCGCGSGKKFKKCCRQLGWKKHEQIDKEPEDG